MSCCCAPALATSRSVARIPRISEMPGFSTRRAPSRRSIPNMFSELLGTTSLVIIRSCQSADSHQALFLQPQPARQYTLSRLNQQFIASSPRIRSPDKSTWDVTKSVTFSGSLLNIQTQEGSRLRDRTQSTRTCRSKNISPRRRGSDVLSTCPFLNTQARSRRRTPSIAMKVK